MRLGTRGSRLAFVQADAVKRMMESVHRDVSVELVPTTTLGDRANLRLRQQVRGKGAFVGDLEKMLQGGEVDAAVHSMKDMPTALGDGLVIAATPAREDRRDVLVSAGGERLEALPKAARVGTSSLRRRAQLLSMRRRLSVLDVSGNVDTRLKKLQRGDYDAIVLAAAGLIRLGEASKITQYFEVDEIMPAPCQGVLAVEVREGDAAEELFGEIDDHRVRSEAMTERAFAEALGSDCDVPAGTSAKWDGGDLTVVGAILAPDGTRKLRGETRGRARDGQKLGRALARDLLSKGGAEILEAVAIP